MELSFRIPLSLSTVRLLLREVDQCQCHFLAPFKSLKTLLALFRKDAFDSSNISYVSSRKNPHSDGGRYQFTINGILTPPKPIDSNAEAWAETVKALHAYGSLDHMGNDDEGSWNTDDGQFLIAIDLESQSHESMFSMNGVGVSTSVFYLTVNFAVRLNTSVTIDVFSYYDGFLVVGVDSLVNVFN